MAASSCSSRARSAVFPFDLYQSFALSRFVTVAVRMLRDGHDDGGTRLENLRSVGAVARTFGRGAYFGLVRAVRQPAMDRSDADY